jgi:hypothetical protein
MVHGDTDYGPDEGGGKRHVAAYGDSRLSYGPDVGGHLGDHEHRGQGEEQLQPDCLEERAGRDEGVKVHFNGDSPAFSMPVRLGLEASWQRVGRRGTTLVS